MSDWGLLHVLRGEVKLLEVEKFIEMEKEKCAMLGIPYNGI